MTDGLSVNDRVSLLKQLGIEKSFYIDFINACIDILLQPQNYSLSEHERVISFTNLLPSCIENRHFHSGVLDIIVTYKRSLKY